MERKYRTLLVTQKYTSDVNIERASRFGIFVTQIPIIEIGFMLQREIFNSIIVLRFVVHIYHLICDV